MNFDIGKDLLSVPYTFNISANAIYNDGRDILKIELLNKDSSETFDFILDMSYVLIDKSKINLEQDNIIKWLNEAHFHIETFFENFITEKLRKMFK
jgi:uncharacterized protein (TIGR04255 family)